MLIYIVFYFIILYLSLKIQKNKWEIYDYIFLTLMILFSGLRYRTGSDYVSYENMFNNVRSLQSAITSRTGIGYFALSYFFRKKLHLSYQLFIFLISFMTNVLIYKFVKKNAEMPGLVMLLFISLGFYTFTFNGFRQSLATMLVIYGFGCMQEQKKMKGLLYYGAGFLIHSIVFVPIVGFTILSIKPKVKIKQVYTVVLAVFSGTIAAFLFYDDIYSYVVYSVKGYDFYAVGTENYVGGMGTYINVLFYILIFIFIIHRKKDTLENENRKNIFFIKASIAGIIINLFSVRNWLFNRVAYPFLIFLAFILASYYALLLKKSDKLRCIGFHIVIAVYYIANIISFNDVVPYKSVFSLLF